MIRRTAATAALRCACWSMRSTSMTSTCSNNSRGSGNYGDWYADSGDDFNEWNV
jgi:hypothetical protein